MLSTMALAPVPPATLMRKGRNRAAGPSASPVRYSGLPVSDAFRRGTAKRWSEDRQVRFPEGMFARIAAVPCRGEDRRGFVRAAGA